jgi:hypothetical protein
MRVIFGVVRWVIFDSAETPLEVVPQVITANYGFLQALVFREKGCLRLYRAVLRIYDP